MQASARPWFTTGVALVGASAIALAPITPMPAAAPTLNVRAAAAVVSPDFDLAALELPYIITLPIVRAQIRNWAENWAVYLVGLGKSGVGVAQSLLSIPGVTVEILQEVLALNFVGAFDTFAAAVRESVVAIGQPLLDSVIWRNQKALLVEAALRAAVPEAVIDAANGFLTAGNLAVTAFIQGTQDLVAAVLTLNLGNIIDATLEGTRNFVVALGDGAGAIVDGIEEAQRGITDALNTTPPPPPTLTDVSTMRTFDNTLSIAGTSGAPGVLAEKQLEVPTGETVLLDQDEAGETDLQDPPKFIDQANVLASGGLSTTPSDLDPPASLDTPAPPKKPVHPLKGIGKLAAKLKEVGRLVGIGKVAAPGKVKGPDKVTGPDKDAVTKDGSEAGDAPSPDGDD